MSQTIEPIRRSIVVRCSVEAAFRVFTDGMTTWWPLETYSRAVSEFDGLKVERVEFQGRLGGRLVEHMSNGEQLTWGEVLAWEPPRRLVIAWKPNATPNPPTKLEVRFTAGDEGTRVDLEHRGWEQLGHVGTEAREDYASGWPVVFDQLYAGAANKEVA